MDEVVHNSEQVSLNGSILGIPFRKAVILVMLGAFYFMAAYILSDKREVLGVIINLVVAAFLSIGSFKVVQMLYIGDHLRIRCMYRYYFEATKKYEINTAIVDELARKPNREDIQ